MASQIKTIKDRVLELLTDDAVYLGVASTSILGYHTQKLMNGGLPALIVWAKGESVVDTPVEANVLEYKRQIQLSVDLWVSGQDDVEDTALALMEKVETVLFKHDKDGDNSVTPAWANMRYTGMELDIQPQAETNYALLTMNFNVDYYREVSYDALPDLEEIRVTTNLSVSYADDEGTATASDIIEV